MLLVVWRAVLACHRAQPCKQELWPESEHERREQYCIGCRPTEGIREASLFARSRPCLVLASCDRLSIVLLCERVSQACRIFEMKGVDLIYLPCHVCIRKGLYQGIDKLQHCMRFSSKSARGVLWLMLHNPRAQAFARVIVHEQVRGMIESKLRGRHAAAGP